MVPKHLLQLMRDSLQHQLVAIVVPDYDVALPWAGKKVPKTKARDAMGPAPTADERRTFRRRSRQLFGAIIQCMPSWLATCSTG